jgi:hypothetical protein
MIECQMWIDQIREAHRKVWYSLFGSPLLPPRYQKEAVGLTLVKPTLVPFFILALAAKILLEVQFSSFGMNPFPERIMVLAKLIYFLGCSWIYHVLLQYVIATTYST